ncbi:lipoprotein [Nonomuraea cavernae]|uniref:Lipoprotein n=1 Tax=Nonomuraea cavernae TaxID=2045107 RepID=A0A918DJU2_9ACTN|nr:lipoprotein [Nonomuraea cavernae]
MALSAACVALLASGCGGGSLRTISTDSAPAAAPESAVAQDRADTDGSAEVSPKSAAKSGRSAGSGENLASNVKLTQQERQVVYVANMTVRAKEVTAAASRAKQIVTSAGGYLSKEESHFSDGGDGSATLEFKVPPARYPEVLASLGKDLGKQLSVNQGTQDVTLQVADVDSRLKSAQEALVSLRTLLKKADTIGQVLEVEREISAREADLESLQARQKELAAQVGMATLTLNLVGPVTVVPEPSEEPAGFLGGLAAGWSALKGFAMVALTVLGAVLPWLIVIVPVVLLVSFLVRRARGRRTPPAVAPAETQAS